MNNASALMPCIDCGHHISKSASSCPKCKSREPRGVKCFVCKPGGSPLSIKIAHHGGGIVYYHPACISMVLSIPRDITCPECGVRLSQYWTWKDLCRSGIVSCKNCGVHNALRTDSREGECNHCKLPVLGFHAYKSYSSEIYHELCFKSIRESIAERQRQSRQRYVLSKKPSIRNSIGMYILITIIAPIGAYILYGIFIGLSEGPHSGGAEVAFFKAAVPTFITLIIVSPLGVILTYALSYLLWIVKTRNPNLP
jgi:hypothetical protein